MLTLCCAGRSWGFVAPLRRPLSSSSLRRATKARLLAATETSLVVRDSASKEARAPGQTWYACGPTVYDATHLGHARTYVCLDLLRRAATRFGGQEIDFAMGVTDVDDKIIARAREEGIEPLALARREEAAFFRDIKRLGCLLPTRVLRVSEHLDEIVTFVGDILDNGYAYTTDDGVWFDVAKLGTRYGVFAEGRGTSQAAAAFVEEAEDSASQPSTKRDRRDFALWKLGEEGIAWDSPFGRGRPGWHIECSAMTRFAFGKHLDLHAGGVDLAFPHHENEIAQWHGVYEGEWCRVWVHTGHLHIEGRKMSKSLKNFITVTSLLETTHPEDFRMFCATHRYRATVSYTPEAIAEARRLRFELRAALVAATEAVASSSAARKLDDGARALLATLSEARAETKAALLDDLDAPTAVQALLRLATRVRQYSLEPSAVPEPLAAAASYLASTLADLGFPETATAWAIDDSPSQQVSKDDDSEALEKLMQFRSQVRNAALAADASPLRGSLLALCDALRDDALFKSRGLAAVDLPDGTSKLVPALVEEDTASKKENTPRRALDLREVAPADLFRVGEYEGKFADFDDTGMPTLDADGNPLSKSMRKKLSKKLERHTLRWHEHHGGGEHHQPQEAAPSPLVVPAN